MENSINEVAATSIQAAFVPSANPFENYLLGEERAFKVSATGLLYPFSKPDLWENLIEQGSIVKVTELRNEGLESSIMKYIPAKDWEGLREFLNQALKPNIIEAAKKDVEAAKAANESAPKYSMETKQTIHHLHKNEKWSKKKIAEELGVTYPTVKLAIEKIDKMNSEKEG